MVIPVEVRRLMEIDSRPWNGANALAIDDESAAAYLQA
jgi:hypothetical protein